MTENEAKNLLIHVFNTYGAMISENFKDDCISETFDMAIKALEEIQQYRAIGTVEECREAVEKQKAKKPTYEGDGYADGELVYDTWICPNCEEHYETDYDDYIYCPNCGQAIDLSEVN